LGLLADRYRLYARLRAELDEAREELRSAQMDQEVRAYERDRAEEARDRLAGEIRDLRSEVNCRIEHGAESGGHLEYVHAALVSMEK